MQANTHGASVWVSHEYKLWKFKLSMHIMDERLYSSFALKTKSMATGDLPTEQGMPIISHVAILPSA